MTRDEQVANVIIRINGKEAQDKIAQLEESAESLRKKLMEVGTASDEGKKAKRELDKVNAQLETLRTNAANVNAAMKRLDQQSPKELKKTIALINKELSSGRVQRGSEEWEEYTQALRIAKEELKKVNKELNAEPKGFFNTIKNWQTAIVGAIGGAFALFHKFKSSIEEAVDDHASMQQEEANVRKYTGMTEAQVNQLNNAFKEMDTRTSREQLNKLAQDAGRLGKQSVEDVLGFVRAADKINVALDDLGDGATLTLSKLTAIFGTEKELGTEKALLSMGSVINELSQNCSASAPYIAEFTSRMGGVAAQSGLTAQQVMAFAAVLDTANINVEASSTALQQFLVRLYKDPAKYAKAAGMDVKKFSEQVKTDVNGAVLELLGRLKEVGGMDVLSPMFADMGENGSNAIKALSALAGKIDEVKAQQEVANQAFEEAISIDNEFAVQNGTVQASLEKAKKKLHETSIELGKSFEPMLKTSINATRLFMQATLALVKYLGEHKMMLISLVSTIAIYTAAVKLSNTHLKWNSVYTAICAKKTQALAVIHQLGSVRAALFTGSLKNVNKELKVLKGMLGGTPWKAAIILIGMLAVSISAFASSTNKAAISQKKLNEIRNKAQDDAQNEISTINRLVEAARDESRSLEDRKKAVNTLNTIIPNYNGQLDETTGKYKENKEALDQYISSLVKSYEIQGAKDQLEEIGKQRSELTRKLREAQREEEQIRSEITASQSTRPATSGGASMPGVALGAMGRSADLTVVQSKIKNINRELEVTKQLEEDIEAIYGEDIFKEITSEPKGGEDDGGGGGGNDDKDADKARKKRIQAALKAVEDINTQEQAKNAIAYSEGEIDYAKYCEVKKELEEKLLDDKIKALEKINETDSSEYGNLLIKKAEKKAKADEDAAKQEKKAREQNRARSLQEAEAQYEQEKDCALDMYLDQNSAIYQNEKAYKQLLFDMEVAYLKKRMALYEEDSKERLDLERKLNAAIKKDQTDKQQEAINKRKQFDQDYNTDKLSQYSESLSKIDQLEEEGIITSAEATHAKLKELSSFLAAEGQEFSAAIVTLSDTIFSYLQDLGANATDIISSGLGVLSAGLSAYSSLVSASRDLEIAKIEKRYDTEIEKAGSNSKKVQKLEKQKEAEVAKVKSKYNKKAMKIEVAQALASTAMAAINSYASASKVSWILGPIAAAMAVAAGMAQVAAIRQQHQAEEAGYYSGGFTGGNDYRKEVGVVHGGEFVANHQAVANPQLLPVLRLIDYAQRNNTVGSLTAADVSVALAQGRGVSARAEAATQSSSAEVSTGLALSASALQAAGSAIDRLSQRLEYPIEAEVVLDGEQGLHRKYTRYQRSLNNPKR